MLVLELLLPEKDFYSREEVAKRWGCEVSLIEHYINEKKILREALPPKNIPRHMTYVPLPPAKPHSHYQWHTWCDDAVGEKNIEDAQLDGSDGEYEVKRLPRFLYLISDAICKVNTGTDSCPRFESMTSVVEGLAGNLYQLAYSRDPWTKIYAAISTEYDLIIPLEEIKRFESQHSEMEIVIAHDIAAHEAAEGPLPGREAIWEALPEGPLPSREAESKRKISGSSHWQRLESEAERAIALFPAWSEQQGRKIQMTGNLQDWLTSTIGVDSREAEIIKKVLKDIFKELQ